MTRKLLLTLTALLLIVATSCFARGESADKVADRKATPSEAAAAADGPPSNALQRLLAGRPPSADTERPRNPLDPLRAFRYVEQICAIGPRISGTPGMEQQRELLTRHFEQLGGKVSLQRFEANHPLTGAKVPMANVVVQWHPDRKERILLCAHYDTRPLPDQDPDPVKRREGVFIGANDGASGVAVLMELAHLMPELDGSLGVDFVLFDGEELVYVERRDPYFLGSTWFARQYAQQPPDYTYRWGVLLDMIGGRNLQIYYERNSISWPETRPLANQIWATAARLGVDEFIPRARHTVHHDHVPLRNIGKIPTCLILDFDYPFWHTEEDLPRRLSPSSLAKVGWVVYEWLRNEVSLAEAQVSRAAAAQ